ncbi:tyrosine protein phosphatase [Brevibacillus ruminantium]|uniref:Tyrosine-protein phosphatase n=1 Tax=Brevibacillus ruminantium TaxID=2950604 RepID=A0ABY4WJ19_9BACL|nr:CpsB/CapC family capsule biosynthesis tyrosine phosphatase [Brevibacillus ruminantium]USG67130.1 tyrosine protein phosphatase [Brevibacillus ruminantium]
MIDLHCHILPSVDDGPRDAATSLEMARMAASEGITDIVASPHTHNGLYENRPHQVIAAVQILQQQIDCAGIPLVIHPGSEVHLHHQLLNHVTNDMVLTIGDQKQHLLLELPVYCPFSFIERVLQDLLKAGITPVIAHPERNEMLRNSLHHLMRWREQKVLFQINAGSLLGQLGRKAQGYAYQLLRHGLVHVLASDGHDTRKRKPSLKAAYRCLDETLSSEVSIHLQWNAQAILRGEPCVNLEPRSGTRFFQVPRFLYPWP